MIRLALCLYAEIVLPSVSSLQDRKFFVKRRVEILRGGASLGGSRGNYARREVRFPLKGPQLGWRWASRREDIAADLLGSRALGRK